jgi:two-component system, NarL family, response regulator DesR
LVLRALVVDDNEPVRRALCELLREHADISVVYEASNGSDAVRLARQHKPDLVLIDIAMPIMNGFEAIRMIKGERPATHVLVVSQFDSPAFLRQATAVGASGYVRKQDAALRLAGEVRRIQQQIQEKSRGRPRPTA